MQGLVVRAKPIGARRWQPIEVIQIRPVELYAIRDALHPVLVIQTASIAAVEQFARHICRIEQPCLLVLELMHAATSAAVAQSFPFARVERGEGLFPKWRVAVHDKSSLALLSATDQAGSLGLKIVKQLGFAFLIVAALATSPVIGQGVTSAGYDLIDAVKKSDGDKAIQILSSHPNGIVDAKDNEGNTSLIVAISRSDEQWTGFLLNKGADPNLSGKAGDTPLIAASRVGFQSAVEWLLGLGAKVDAVNKMGETPLIIAVQQRELPIVRLLLARGANPDRTDNAAGYSARDYATRDPRAREILKLIVDKKPKAAISTAN